MKDEYRLYVLELHSEVLCKGMDPARVVSRLVKYGVFKQIDVELVDHEVSVQEKNLKIIDTLLERDFQGLSQFLRALMSIDHAHCQLAETLQPVQHRIVWFAPSPTHAASVVYTLERHAGAKFSGMERAGPDKSLVLRRARVFTEEYDREDFDPTSEQEREEEEEEGQVPVDVGEVVRWSHRTEVCLFFPASSCAPLPALKGLFAAREGLMASANLLLMGMTQEEGGRKREGTRVQIAMEVSSAGERSGAGLLAGDKLEALKDSLSRSLKVPSQEVGVWLEEERDSTDGKVELDFCTLTNTDMDTSTENGSSSIAFTDDPLVQEFSSLCREKCPGKANLLCRSVVCKEEEGELAPVKLGLESRAAVTCSCVLMEVSRHLHNSSKPY